MFLALGDVNTLFLCDKSKTEAFRSSVVCREVTKTFGQVHHIFQLFLNI